MNSKKEKKKKKERQNTLQSQTMGKGLSQHTPGHRFEFFH